MKPYYESKLGKLYHGDCLQIMPELEPVDLVLTDPPYSNGTEYDTYKDNDENLRKIISGLFPAITEKAVVVLITPGVSNIQLYPRADWILSWVTMAGCGSGPWGFCCWQPILAYGDDPFLKNGKGRRPDTINVTRLSDKNTGHPCPKPIGLIQLIIQRASINETDSILDLFVGSGSIPIACERLNRRWIGIEISEKYCEIAAKRIELEASQLKLWGAK